MSVFKTLTTQSFESQKAYIEFMSHHRLPSYYTMERIRITAKKNSYVYLYVCQNRWFGHYPGRDVQQLVFWVVAEVPVHALLEYLLLRASSMTTQRLTVSFHKNLRKCANIFRTPPV